MKSNSLKDINWKKETCKNCDFRNKSYCKRFPPNIKDFGDRYPIGREIESKPKLINQ